MIKIFYTKDKDEKVGFTKDELEALLKEAHDEGYSEGYSAGLKNSTTTITTPPYDYYHNDDSGWWKYQPMCTGDAPKTYYTTTSASTDTACINNLSTSDSATN